MVRVNLPSSPRDYTAQEYGGQLNHSATIGDAPMRRLAILLTLTTSSVLAQHPDEMMERKYVGPEQKDIELIEVRETPPYGSDRPLVAKVSNNSKYYLDRVAIQCNITDERGFRIYKDIVFKSSPVFSIKSQWPPITSQELGIPPGTVTDVGLYSTDTRWSRGFGKYKYDCHMYGVAGQD
jgi:hypothetical protein